MQNQRIKKGDYVIDTQKYYFGDVGIVIDDNYSIKWLSGEGKGGVAERATHLLPYLKIVSESEALARLI